jgi:ectoine hydroxylase-related dioxygenase (phytanoyl-CoA dioxygenase family)
VNRPLDPALRAHFEDHGWAVLRGVLRGEQIEAAEQAFDAILAPCQQQAAAGQRIWQLPGAGRYHAALLAHLFGELGAIVADLLDANRLQLLQDTLIVKPPRVGASVDLHQDYTYTGFIDPPRSGSVRLALRPERVEDGCLYVVRGSHRWGVRGGYAAFTDRIQTVDPKTLSDEMRAAMEAGREPVELEAGDVSVHHCLTFHGSFENTGTSTRKTIVAHVFDGSCRLLPERLPAAAVSHFRTDAAGRLSAETFPVLYESSSQSACSIGVDGSMKGQQATPSM